MLKGTVETAINFNDTIYTAANIVFVIYICTTTTNDNNTTTITTATC